jgi:hypothetical protein
MFGLFARWCHKIHVRFSPSWRSPARIYLRRASSKRKKARTPEAWLVSGLPNITAKVFLALRMNQLRCLKIGTWLFLDEKGMQIVRIRGRASERERTRGANIMPCCIGTVSSMVINGTRDDSCKSSFHSVSVFAFTVNDNLYLRSQFDFLVRNLIDVMCWSSHGCICMFLIGDNQWRLYFLAFVLISSSPPFLFALPRQTEENDARIFDAG